MKINKSYDVCIKSIITLLLYLYSFVIVERNGDGLKNDYLQLDFNSFVLPTNNNNNITNNSANDWLVTGFMRKLIKCEDFKNNLYEYKISIIPLTVGCISFFFFLSINLFIFFFNRNATSIPFFESRV